ncbi:MAG: hypothetical protein KC501_27895 [Myxococcales bacterium]|nr:hypothetical protein [Myxococcales bacterium]
MASPQSAARVLLGILVVAASCRREHVIGVLDGSGTTEDGSADGSTTERAGTSLDGTITMTGESSSDGPPIECGAPTGHSACDFDGDPFHAIGLGCPGGEQDTQPILDPVLASPDPDAWRVIREYGNPTWTPREGSTLLVVTTGTLPLADDSNRVELPLGVTDAVDGGNGNPDGEDLPAPVVPSPGSMGGAGGRPFSACDGLGDCSDSLLEPWQAGGPAQDLAWMAFDVDVPADTAGYRVALAWFTAELPARHTEPGTDVVVWWQSSEAYTGNLATLEGAPLSAWGAAPWVASQGLLGNDSPLFGTGFDGTTGNPCELPGASFVDCPRGAGSGWLTLWGPSAPGERMSIVLAVMDLMDDDRDTTVLVDDWRWHCEGCQPGLDCGLRP